MVTVKIDMSRVADKLDRISTDRQLGIYASQQAARLMEPFVPFDQGTLTASARTDEPYKVTYDTPYARRQYYGVGFNFQKQKHPKAKAEWAVGPDWQELSDLLTAKARTM